MSTKFNAGDLVELKSGGPVMTIEKANPRFGGDEQAYYCSWFAGAKDNHKVFAEAALKAATIEE